MCRMSVRWRGKSRPPTEERTWCGAGSQDAGSWPRQMRNQLSHAGAFLFTLDKRSNETVADGYLKFQIYEARYLWKPWKITVSCIRKWLTSSLTTYVILTISFMSKKLEPQYKIWPWLLIIWSKMRSNTKIKRHQEVKIKKKKWEQLRMY